MLIWNRLLRFGKAGTPTSSSGSEDLPHFTVMFF